MSRRRWLAVAALAAVVVAIPAAAADFQLRMISQTSTTITIGWNAQEDVAAYVFYANGKRVSHTFDGNRTSATFAKVPGCVSGCYAVEDLSSDGQSSYPLVVVPPPTGQVFLSPSGNDTAACTQTAPCRSMQRGFFVAQSGQTVVMAAGSYPNQSLVNTHKTVTFKASGVATLAGQLRLECTTGITVDGVSAANLLVAAGNKNLVVKNSAFGGGTYTANNEDDPVVIGNVGSCSQGSTSDGVLLDNIRIHDYFWQQDPGSAHTDCLQFYGGSNNVTIRNSVFERCAESFIGAFPDFGDIRNTVVEDTTFRDLSLVGKGTFFAMQWGCPGHSYTATGITFRRNIWSPGVPRAIRTDCANFLVEGNTFQTGPGQFACDDYDARWGGTVVWRNNTFLNGNGCTT